MKTMKSNPDYFWTKYLDRIPFYYLFGFSYLVFVYQVMKVCVICVICERYVCVCKVQTWRALRSGRSGSTGASPGRFFPPDWTRSSGEIDSGWNGNVRCWNVHKKNQLLKLRHRFLLDVALIRTYTQINMCKHILYTHIHYNIHILYIYIQSVRFKTQFVSFSLRSVFGLTLIIKVI